MRIDLILGDCLQKMKELPENSVDAIVTDPPYGLEFMGKDWDEGVPGIHFWQEMIRVLKPGGHLLSFGGTRTYHRMASAIEDAGFEIRDMINWCYGSGFPKSLNIGKSVNQLETNEWSKIGKALDNIDKKRIIEVWKSNSNNVKIVETQSLKNQIIAGQDTLSENFVVLNVAQNNNQESLNLLVSFVEQNLNEVQAISTKTNTALQNVEIEIRQLQNNVKSAEQQSQNQNHKSWNIFTAQCDVKEWLNENTEVNHKVDEALKTLRGNKKYSNEEITNVLCAVIPSVLKLTILNQSKTFQNLDTNQKMECVSAINVIITEYIMDNLISNTVAILKGKAVDKLQGNERKSEIVKGKIFTGSNNNINGESGEYLVTKGTSEWEGWGTALKPSHEPICMARKPLSEKTVAENVLKYGTGGINIDESRVKTSDKLDGGGTIDKSEYSTVTLTSQPVRGRTGTETGGRFPANLIHDNSEEVRECFPNESERFFKSIIYQAKASKSERNKGCDRLEEKQYSHDGREKEIENPYQRNKSVATNNHPTVKPIALMEYLIKMVTREDAVVFDPFMGSGSTGVACKKLNRNFIGIELDADYMKIAQSRINSTPLSLL